MDDTENDMDYPRGKKKIGIHSSLSVFTPHNVALLVGEGNRAGNESCCHKEVEEK